MAELSAPLWLQTFERSLPVGRQYVLHGNVSDLWLLGSHQAPDGSKLPRLVSTLDAVWETLSAAGYRFLARWDPVTQQLAIHGDGDADVAGEMLAINQFPLEVTRTRLGAVLGTFANRVDHRGAIAIDLASRVVTDRSHPNDDDTRFFAACQLAAANARPARLHPDRPAALFNPVIWLAQRDTDLPSWFLADTEGLRSLRLERPDLEDRLTLGKTVGRQVPGWNDADDASQAAFVRTLAEDSDGFSTTDLLSISSLMIDQQLGLREVGDAVTVHRSGVLENPWKRGALRDRLLKGEERIRDRVLGQRRAIAKVLDVLKRSATGLTAAHRGSSNGPRGVLFLAGPTGVGKTELAKAVTHLIYGSEDAMIRFDMSEFASEYTEARLIGAPPGYVGHDSGGELTGAVRNRPFSLVLLDEIDKAHGRILDKFLQILDDGRLTDSHGRTVDFRESLIVFTSNLGVLDDKIGGHAQVADRAQLLGSILEILGDEVDAPTAAESLAHPDRPPLENERIVREAVQRHFTHKLGRPELLNRIGDNILVLDFIDRETGQQILDRMLDQIKLTVSQEQGVTLNLRPVGDELASLCLDDLRFGGRGIGNVLEGRLVNPLARALFDGEAVGPEVEVTGLYVDDDGVSQVRVE